MWSTMSSWQKIIVQLLDEIWKSYSTHLCLQPFLWPRWTLASNRSFKENSSDKRKKSGISRGRFRILSVTSTKKKREKRLSPCDGEVENVCEWVWNLISIPITTVRQLNVHVTDNCLLVLSVCKGSVLTATAVAQSGPLQEYPAATSQGWWSPHKPKEHTGIKLASSHKITTVAKLQHISDYIVTLTIPLDLNVWRRGLHSRWTRQRSLRCARSGQSDDFGIKIFIVPQIIWKCLSCCFACIILSLPIVLKALFCYCIIQTLRIYWFNFSSLPLLYSW